MYMEFCIINNVEITVKNERSKAIVQKVKIHNKATRNMVEGIMRFLLGNFTKSYLLDDIQYDENTSKKYVPCYMGFGVGGIEYTIENGKMKQSMLNDYLYVPKFNPEWNSYVEYKSNKLVNEIIGVRTKIGGGNKGITDTFTDIYGKYIKTGSRDNESEMDSVMFYCKVEPGTLQDATVGVDRYGFAKRQICVSEIGMFPSGISGSCDMLSHVKLCNYKVYSGGDFEGEYTSDVPLKLINGFLAFQVPKDMESESGVVSTCIARGTFRVLNENDEVILTDKEGFATDASETKGYIYNQSEEIVGLVDYEHGVLRLYNPYTETMDVKVSYATKVNVPVKSNALYITDEDSIEVRWVITLAAIGKDNVFKKSVKKKYTDDNTQYDKEDVVIIPETGSQIISDAAQN